MRVDITGMRSGRLVAIAPSHQDPRGVWLWTCKCDCGGEKVVKAGSIKEHRTLSCGCALTDALVVRNRTHGRSRDRVYEIWWGMMTRCFNERAKAYSKYGGRGITTDPAWRKFDGFFADMGEPPEGMTLERIDNDGNYCKSNCKWATHKDQARNRRTSRLITHNGETLTLAEWAERTGIGHTTIKQRIDKLGWSIDRALSVPATAYRSSGRES